MDVEIILRVIQIRYLICNVIAKSRGKSPAFCIGTEWVIRAKGIVISNTSIEIMELFAVALFSMLESGIRLVISMIKKSNRRSVGKDE
ncbi:hypothetical protein D3C75_446100 [compost metagenome]